MSAPPRCGVVRRVSEAEGRAAMRLRDDVPCRAVRCPNGSSGFDAEALGSGGDLVSRQLAMEIEVERHPRGDHLQRLHIYMVYYGDHGITRGRWLDGMASRTQVVDHAHHRCPRGQIAIQNCVEFAKMGIGCVRIPAAPGNGKSEKSKANAESGVSRCGCERCGGRNTSLNPRFQSGILRSPDW
jgi:hypothetical protein